MVTQSEAIQIVMRELGLGLSWQVNEVEYLPEEDAWSIIFKAQGEFGPERRRGILMADGSVWDMGQYRRLDMGQDPDAWA